ncbi:MAG: alkene reductase [Verrucomicrobiota bacterium]
MKLLENYQLVDLTLSNRIALAPMTRARAGAERIPNDTMAEYYIQRASAGLIITEATTVSEQANGWVQSPGLYTQAMAEGWTELNEAVHQAGGTIFTQLWHCGRASHSSFNNGNAPVAPSPIKINGEGVHTAKGKLPHETPRALETKEIPGLIQSYRDAASRAKDAGFDGIEIHSANGYLLDEFLQSKTNHRTDAYGGSIENRFRLLRDILEAVIEIWPSKRVAVRLSPNGVFNDMGSSDYREQFTYAAEQLDAFNLAYLHVMDGLAFGFHELGEPMTLADFRNVYRGTLMGNCGYNQKTAEEAVKRGDADMIAIGRPFISNPDLVARYQNNWPLNPDAAVEDWYTPKGAAGYTDFPIYRKQTA